MLLNRSFATTTAKHDTHDHGGWDHHRGTLSGPGVCPDWRILLAGTDPADDPTLGPVE